jgi:hypothetical protein
MKNLILTVFIALFCASSFALGTITDNEIKIKATEIQNCEADWERCVQVWLRTECDFQGLNCYEVQL